jgi:hypothetical protein
MLSRTLISTLFRPKTTALAIIKKGFSHTRRSTDGSSDSNQVARLVARAIIELDVREQD